MAVGTPLLPGTPPHLPSYWAFGTADGEMTLTSDQGAQILCEMAAQEDKKEPVCILLWC